jgi:dipeptidyl aminopeptidase/acylaminoacyl peptidase
MVETLKEAGVTARFHPIPDAGHMEAFLNADALAAALAFLDEHLRPAAAGAQASDQ